MSDDVHFILGEIRGELRSIKDLVERQNGRVGKLEDKVDGLRRWQAAVIGLFTAAGTGIGTALTSLWKNMTG